MRGIALCVERMNCSNNEKMDGPFDLHWFTSRRTGESSIVRYERKLRIQRRWLTFRTCLYEQSAVTDRLSEAHRTEGRERRQDLAS